MSEPPEKFAVGLAMVVAMLVLVASVIALGVDPETFMARKDQFESAVTQTLLPMLGVIAAAIVGKEVAAALKRP